MDKTYYVYIATNQRNTVIYTGTTSNLENRMWQHKNKIVKGFTKRYNVDKLVFYETFSNPQDAIVAEKKIKGWTRQKKIDLIKKIILNLKIYLNCNGILRFAQDDKNRNTQMNQKTTNFFITWKETLLSGIIVIICLSLFRFFPADGAVQDLTRIIFFFGLIPALYIIFILKKRLKEFGLSFPIDRTSIVWFLAMLSASLLVFYIVFRFTPFANNYTLPEYAIGNFAWFLLYELVFINVWLFFLEAFFKGFVLFTFARKLGILSVFVSFITLILFLAATGSMIWNNTPIIIISFFGGILAFKNRSFVHSYLMGLLFIIMTDAYMIYALKQYL